jgi:hypothetical protein
MGLLRIFPTHQKLKLGFRGISHLIRRVVAKKAKLCLLPFDRPRVIKTEGRGKGQCHEC